MFLSVPAYHAPVAATSTSARSDMAVVPIPPLRPLSAQIMQGGKRRRVNEISAEKAQALSHRDLIVYTRNVGGGSAPNRKDGHQGSLATVLDYIRSRDGRAT